MPPLFQWIGAAASRIRFNRTVFTEIEGAGYWAKRRLPWSSLLVLMANSYAKATGLPMRMLGERRWLDYEGRVYEELLPLGKPLRNGQCLFLPHVRGKVLRGVLGSGNEAEKQRTLELATLELARLHGCQILHPLAGRLQPFSHADATSENVVVDLERGRATWLDFETIHPFSMPSHFRQADDLRTFLYGLAMILPAQELSVMVRRVVVYYDNASVLNALKEIVCCWNRRPNARLLLMPGIGEAQWKCLMGAVSVN